MKTKFISMFLSLFCLLGSPMAHATFVDLNYLMFTDSFKTSSTVSTSRTMYDIGFGALLGKPEQWIWTVNYGVGSFSDKNTTTTTYSFTDLGVKLGAFWTKSRNWFTTITYNLQSTAKYNDGTSEVELRGTSIKADLGYTFWPTESVGVAARLSYYAPSYKESISGTTLTKVSYTRTLITPCISMMFYY
jgi:hypothetical protein